MESAEIKRLKDLDRDLVWHPFTQMREYAQEDPLIVERGEGCYLYDIEGQRYLDGVSSLWVNVHGHRKAEVDQAIRQQLERVAHSTLLGVGNVPSIYLAEKLLALAPKNLRKVFYSDSGSTSVEVALKMAFQYWKQKGVTGRNKFITLENAYHGDTVGSVSVGGIELFHSLFKPLLFESIPIKNFSLDHARKIFSDHAHEVAACIIEPMVQGAAGMRLQPPGFVRGIRELCDEFKVLLICDEVATGFGRTGKMFAVEHEGVRPDFLCLAKGISAGYLPLAATLTTQELYSAFEGSYTDFKSFFHGHSYTGNPLACAAALANLKIFAEEKIITGLEEKIPFFTEELKKFSAHPHVLEVRQMGMMVAVELIQDKAAKIPFPVEQRMAHRVCQAARKRGGLFRPLGDVLVLLPPLSISGEQIHEMVDILYQSLESVIASAAKQSSTA
jgi:adenosylmethionine---8-amino-7-oxononanoate aminotransferase